MKPAVPAPLTLPSVTLPSTFVIFDRATDVAAFMARLKALAQWCADRDVTVVGDVEAWDADAALDRPAALDRAINLCHHTGAALLVADVDTISPLPIVARSVLRDLEPREAWTPQGQLILNLLHGMVMVSES